MPNQAPAQEKISGPQKAAVLLFSLGEDLAAEIVKNLDEDELRKLGGSMSRVFSLAPEVFHSVFSEFHQLAGSSQSLALNPGQRSTFMKNVFSKAIRGEKAQALIDEIQKKGKENLFQKVRKLDAKTLANFIGNEHPQTIAVVLSHLDPGHAAGILEELPEKIQNEVLFRIAQLEKVPPAILEEIDQILQEEISVVENADGGPVGGIRSAAEILNQMKSSAETQVLQALEEQQQGLADELRRWMFVFENLVNVDDRSIMAILKEVEADTLKVALKTASEELKEKIFKNMSERAVTMIKEDLEVMGPVRLKDVEAAQQAIIKIGKKLEAEGKAILTGKGKEDVFV
ncbi:MAG: flagellar motor switch protein FliG [Deltaproteobacteria bacterium]|jgi:flagellar motor switch protein FliG|nr:flagellar motor switch protein FliG [Deltaproteobacteria bacterium]